MHKTFLFVLASSRLGLFHPPKGETHRNIGVEGGPEHVLSQEFLSKFSKKEIIKYSFSAPEDVKEGRYYQQLAEEYEDLISQIVPKLHDSTLLVTAGGDHSVSLASVSSILQVHNADTTGLIMIDSHADLHTSETTVTGNFHGMWLRVLCDNFPVKSIDQLAPEKIKPHNLLYIGNLDAEAAEQEYINNNNISICRPEQLGSSLFDRKIDYFLSTMSHIHVSIDIDGFSHQYAPATGMHIRQGLNPGKIIPVLHKLKTHPSISVDLVEVNPSLSGGEITIKLAQQLLMEILH